MIQPLAQFGPIRPGWSAVIVMTSDDIDRDGTLTKNQMTVKEVWAVGRRATVSGIGGFCAHNNFYTGPREEPAPRRKRRVIDSRTTARG